MSSDTQEEAPPLAVSALRSKFEKLAQDGSPVSATPSKSAGSMSALSRTHDSGLLTPSPTRHRAASGSDVALDAKSPSAMHHIRTSSSSSDLKIGRRPPPPPPPRSPKPGGSPIAKPTIVPSSPILSPDKPALISRKPPPPPGIAQNEENIETGVLPAGGVASLRNKFTINGAGERVSPTRPIPVAGSRVVSHSSAISSPRQFKAEDPPQYNHRHSVSALPDNGPLICFDDDEDKPPAPPLPSRPSPNPFESESSSSSNGIRDPEAPLIESPESTHRPRPPPSPLKNPKTRPVPPRHASLPMPAIETATTSNNDAHESSSSKSNTPTLQVPPPLPIRRSPPNSMRDLPQQMRPSLRTGPVHETDTHDGLHSAPPAMERKAQFAPPPVRTIALGDKLPPPRRPPSNEGSDSESVDDEEAQSKGGRAGELPDASHSSRRPPLPGRSEFARARIPVTAHTGIIAVAGAYVVTAHHHVKVYDLTRSGSFLYNIDLKEAGFEWRGKDPRVTSMEFRPAGFDEERGRFVWIGTKDGTIWELDVQSGQVTTLRYTAHAAAVTHIFRQGLNMVSLDENGKVLVFSPDPETGVCAGMLTNSSPRVVRITEKQGFAKILGGLLWTSGGPGSSGAAQANGTGTSARGPVVRVYNILAHSGGGKSLLPLECTGIGAVTSGTVLQSSPGKVFLGHEGGFISVWDLHSEDGMPACTEVVKVSASDVLCLEGVCDRLWAGGRKGLICAYNVDLKPWVITNSWMAHSDLPVQKLFIDPFSIEKCIQLSVISVGRDEEARFWDGLLGINWIDAELSKRESSFSVFRPLTALIVSWNVDAAKPDTLTGCPENVNFFDEVLKSVELPDIIAFGFQELIDLESRKMAAKTVLLGGKKKAADGSISEKVSRSYKMWHDRLNLAVRLAMPPDCPYTVVHAENLVGLFSCIFIKSSERRGLKDVAITTVKRGIGGMYGNKGGIVARLVIDDSSICFINCHLAAGQHHVRARNADVAAVLDEKEVFPVAMSDTEFIAYAGGGDGTMVLDHEFVFLNGDLNYRIDQRREAAIGAVHAGQIEQLLAHDQLLREMRVNRSFRLHTFVEAPITFAPTYKYDRRSNNYDSSEKNRIPAWCDRILYRTRDANRVQNLHYRRYEANVSDHRPISAAFRITAKSVDHGKRSRAKAEVEDLWLDQQVVRLSDARTFYVEQALL